MPRQQKDTSQEPWIENYPPLDRWLRRHEARCMTQIRSGNGFLEIWMIKGQQFVVEVRENQHGWNVYTASRSMQISDTLADAEKRLGLE